VIILKISQDSGVSENSLRAMISGITVQAYQVEHRFHSREILGAYLFLEIIQIILFLFRRNINSV
jgi:hypothetical protein